jgi:hypothetical protein
MRRTFFGGANNIGFKGLQTVVGDIIGHQATRTRVQCEVLVIQGDGQLFLVVPSLQNRGEPPGGEIAPDFERLVVIAPTAAIYVVVLLAGAIRRTVLPFVRQLLLLLFAPSHPRKGVASDE